MGRLKGGTETDTETAKRVIRDPHHDVALVVRLESNHPLRKRYLVIVSCPESHANTSPSNALKSQSQKNIKQGGVSPSKCQDSDYCLLGVDSIYARDESGAEDLVSVSIGLVVKLVWGTKISLDGDGGFSVLQLGSHFVFKPNSVQALWTAIQTLHLISGKLKPKRHSLCLSELDWVKGYESDVSSPQSCINDWHYMPDVLSRRAPDPDELTRLTTDEVDQETKKTLMKAKLREIMKTVDLDNITSKKIRVRLEQELNQNLDHLKAFIDEEILLILGQMDPASAVFDFLYLGSEWNASNLEELNSNGVTHILNVTREIDNFYPSVFQYLNIREYDVEETDLLKYWDKTYLFIKDCLVQGGKVLVHCKMGISRSASTVVAFAMKYFDWTMDDSLDHVKKKRGVIDPNKGFRQQLQVYEGILEASKQRSTFRKQRSKSESNVDRKEQQPGHRKPSLQPSDKLAVSDQKERPKSWSPPDSMFSETSSVHSTEVKDAVVCHCYSQLAQYFADKNAKPSNIGGPRRAAVVSTEISDLVEAKNLKVRVLAPEQEEEEDMQMEDDPNEDDICPAKSHINQCTCNLEIELKVAEQPVSMTEHQLCPETDLMLKNIGNFPIHIRQGQRWNSVVFTGLQDGETSTDPEDTLKENNRFIGLDTSGAEELSVKTLADMFDFKLNEEPSKPPLTPRHNRIGESKIDEIAKKLSINEYSQC